MSSNYQKDMYRQLAELLLTCDSLTKDVKNLKSEHKQDIINLKTEHKQNILILKEEHKIEIERLNAKIDTLEQKNIILKNDNERMKRILNTDSSNSSKPPSSDIKGNNPNHFSSRIKTGKKAGGQKGRKGVTLTKQSVENKIARGELKHQVISVGTPSAKYESRYMLDLKIESIVTEYRFYEDADGKITIPKEFNAPVTYGPTLKSIAVYLYSEGAMSIARIQDFINSVAEGISISSGCVYSILTQFHKKITPYLETIIEKLLNSEVVFTDGTNVRSEGRNAFIRNQSTKNAVIFTALTHKSLEMLRSCKVLAKFSGILVHDHEVALYHFGSGHGECNVHIERYLRKNSEETKNGWSSQLEKVLQTMHLDKKAKALQEKSFTMYEIENYEKQYDDIVNLGRKENAKTIGTYAKKSEKTLLNRLEKHKNNHLLFLRIPEVAYENNLSERDLRKCKVKQKVSGCFRKQSGTEMYCAIISFTETCKRKKLTVMKPIQNVFMNEPVLL